MKPSGEYSAFISYASDNRDKADEICASLEGRGLVCWIAPRDIRAGREYGDEIILGLERSAAVVLVLSEAANTSVFVLREIERAVSKEINVIPVRIEEVTPSPGLELFISGTHWLDVWRGDWDDHMNRLVRDLGDAPAGASTVEVTAGRRSVPATRSLRKVYVAVGLALVVMISAIAIWSVSQPTPPQAEPVVRPDTGPATGPVPNPSATTAQEERERPDVTPPVTVNPTPREPRGTAPPRSPAPGSAPISREVAPPVRAAIERAPAAVEPSSALSAARDDYDNLALRGGVIDDALDQLWEEMKPNSPRMDMVTHQRSLRTNLTRSRDAIADKDAAAARRYLDNARADLAALEQFLNR